MKTNILVLFTMVAIISACTQKKADQQVQDDKVVVKTIKVEEIQYNPFLTYSGVIKANKEAALGAALPGRVEKLYFKEGDNVKEGTLIAEMSAEMLMQAQAENTALKKDFERLQRLKDKGSVSDMNYDHVKAQLEASDAKVAMLLKNTRIVAPFSGMITDVNVQEGENFSLVPTGIDLNNFSLSSGVVKLMQINPVKVVIEVGEKDLPNISKGQPATVVLDAYPGKTIAGKVSYIKPVLSNTTHTATVEIEAQNQGLIMKPGMYAKVTLSAPVVKGLFVPSNAIAKQEGMGEEYVFILEGNKVHRVNITKVYTAEEKVAVTGLEAGQEVVTSGKNKLSEGVEVIVKNN